MKSKKILIGLFASFFIGFFFLSPGGVMALAQLATSTPTFIPPSVTPTGGLFECPVGTPAGWGTYTPSALWELECSSCASVVTPTSTTEPTFTPNPTYVYLTQAACQTAPVGGEVCYTALAPTSTVVPSVTPTVTPTGNVYFTGTCSVEPTGGNTVDTCNKVSNTLINVVDYDAWSPYGRFVGASIYSSVTTTVSIYIYATFTTSASTFEYNHNWYGTGTYTAGVPNSTYEWVREVQVTAGQTRTYIVGYRPNPNVYSQKGADVWLSIGAPYNPNGTPTATITPTGTPYFDTGFCASVSPKIDEFGFDLFIPDGAPNCSMGWDEFGVGDYTVPAVQICFQPSQFGVIRLFGNDYEVGVYGLAAAAAFLWRYFRTV